MPNPMRMAISATTVLGLVLLALALSGISALGAQLEQATPKRAPGPLIEEVQYRSREVDCPAPRKSWKRI